LGVTTSGYICTTRDFVAGNKPCLNRKGQELKTNITDPDSAKMATSKGVIQGYAAQAAVDSALQIIAAGLNSCVVPRPRPLPSVRPANCGTQTQTPPLQPVSAGSVCP